MSAIRFQKRITKFMITIALPKKFGSKGFVRTVEIIRFEEDLANRIIVCVEVFSAQSIQ